MGNKLSVQLTTGQPNILFALALRYFRHSSTFNLHPRESSDFELYEDLLALEPLHDTVETVFFQTKIVRKNR